MIARRPAAFYRCLAFVSLILAMLPVNAGAQAACRFENRFAALAALLPYAAGTCTTGEHTEPEYPGWVVQRSTTGMMFWRESDGYTGFTDGNWIWKLEADGTLTRSLPPRPTPEVPPTPTPGSERGCFEITEIAYGGYLSAFVFKDTREVWTWLDRQCREKARLRGGQGVSCWAWALQTTMYRSYIYLTFDQVRTDLDRLYAGCLAQR
jgi:hypothetical protein